jgi:hypothetical protein
MGTSNNSFLGPPIRGSQVPIAVFPPVPVKRFATKLGLMDDSVTEFKGNSVKRFTDGP